METGYDEIEVGWTVYTADNQRLGSVREVNLPEGYLMVQKGRVFTQDLYLPLEAIAHARNGAVHLLYDQAQIDARDWDSAPTMPLGVSEAGERDEPTVVVPAGEERTVEEQGSALSLPVHEEELVAGTRTIEVGTIGVHRDTVEEPDRANVAVRHDEVRVERVPMDAAYEGDDAFRETVIEIPLMSQRLIVGKAARVVEEVRVYKRAVVDEEQVSDTVRKERVHVEEHPAGEP
jgi:uncharacterized protein (TIGR02271 family)